MHRKAASKSLRLAAAACAALLSGCGTLGYYGHLAHGEYALLAARRPIARVIDDPAVDPKLKARLELAERARAFASDALALPRNASYTQYADLKRRYATWNVFAAPEFSIDAVTHCYPIVGCLAYRGYFDQARAQAEAARLSARGLDTWVGGSVAYSTLGWFADPILNTMLRWDDDELAATIFHELAHQKLFVDGDTAFNESFATFVQEQGLSQWRAARGLAPDDAAGDRRRDEFDKLVLDARARLGRLYAQPLPPALMRSRKREQIERLRREYFELRDTRWHGHGDYDDWIEAPINNAKLLPFGLYRKWVPAFATLFARNGSNWPAFHVAAAKIAALAEPARTRALERLLPPGAKD